MSEYYNANIALERAANLLLNAEIWDQAAALFAALTARDPSQTLAWYGLSNALTRYAGAHDDLAAAQTAYSCVLRSLEEDSANQKATELRAWMSENPPLRESSVGALGSYCGNGRKIHEALFSASRLVEALGTFGLWTERMQLVMFLGDQNMEAVVPVLAHALEHDAHPDVRMAAMNRLRGRGEHHAVRHACERVEGMDTWQEIERYFTSGLRGMRTEWATALVARLATPGPGWLLS